MKPVLILQGRPEDAAADEEYASILRRGGLADSDTIRVRLERAGLPDGLRLDAVSATIMGGGPACISDDPASRPPEEQRIVDGLNALLPEICVRDLPFLGCCYGIGALAAHLGAPVTKDRHDEPVSIVSCRLTPEGRADPVLSGIPDSFAALVGHKEAVQSLPADTAHLVVSDTCPFQMIRHKRNVYATQFHPESDADSFALRIDLYKDRGYFDPDEAVAIKQAVRAEPVDHSHRVLASFIARYVR